MYYEVAKRKRAVVKGIVISVACVLLLAIIGGAFHHSTRDNYVESTQPAQEENLSEKNKSQAAPEQSPSIPAVTKLYPVLDVVDGDTIDINYDGDKTRIRLIGVNTPESVDPRKSVECFGQEASHYLEAKLTGRQVSIESDPTQSDRDKYNRLLRYVYLDGEDIALSIITNGYGYEYTYNIPYQKQSSYKAAESEAYAYGRGLWASDACSGSTSPSSVATPSHNVSSNTQPKTSNSSTKSCLHFEAGRCWDELEDEAYSAGLYDQQYGRYGASVYYDESCDSVCQDILDDAYDEGWYDHY